MAHCHQGPRAQTVRHLLGLHLYSIWQEDVAKMPKGPGALCNVNPARTTTCW